jgi:hypothetical protein
MAARCIVAHVFFAYLSFIFLKIGVACIDEYGAGWLWLVLFFSGAFTLGLQTNLLWAKISAAR